VSGAKDFRDLLDHCRAVGWAVEQRSSGHFKITPNNGSPVLFVSGSGDFRAIKNERARMRRAGLEEAEAVLAEKKETPMASNRYTPEDDARPAELVIPSPPAEPRKVDQMLLGMMQLGRLVDSLPQETRTKVLQLLHKADELGLNPGELRDAIEAHTAQR
jgi:hypothetical protein